MSQPSNLKYLCSGDSIDVESGTNRVDGYEETDQNRGLRGVSIQVPGRGHAGIPSCGEVGGSGLVGCG
jgi:hypothetical protein